MSERALDFVSENDTSTRGILAVNLGIAYWHAGQMDPAAQNLVEAQMAAQETGNISAMLAAVVFLARVHAVRGNLHQAARMLEQAIEKGKKAPIVGLAHLDLGYLHYELNDLNTCRDHLQQGQMINEASGNIEYQVRGYMLQARLKLAERNTNAIAESLAKIQELEQAGEVPGPTQNRIVAFQIEMALKQDDLTGAQQLAAQLDEDVEAHPFYRFIGLNKARLLIAEGEPGVAGQVRAMKKTADEAGWRYGGIAARIMESIAAEDQEAGLLVLIEAVKQAQGEGYLRAFADHGRILEPNLVEAAQRGIHPEYIGRILAVIHQEAEQEAASEEIVEPLSEREIEVLCLVAAGLSNREIAEKLYLSPGTIKTHVHNICGKLGASNRTQAVGVARDLRLI
jgi:LuxR family maltose regulon positive regulatory protein